MFIPGSLNDVYLRIDRRSCHAKNLRPLRFLHGQVVILEDSVRNMSAKFCSKTGEIKSLLSVAVALLGVVCFIEYKKIDLVHSDERVHEALGKHFCSAYNDHVLFKVFGPRLLGPKIASHGTTEALYLLINISLKDSELLKDQSHRIDLQCC